MILITYKQLERKVTKMFNTVYYPDEITTAFSSLVTDITEEEKKDLENGLYYLHSICENSLNSDYFRTTYKILERLAERIVFNNK